MEAIFDEAQLPEELEALFQIRGFAEPAVESSSAALQTATNLCAARRDTC